MLMVAVEQTEADVSPAELLKPYHDPRLRWYVVRVEATAEAAVHVGLRRRSIQTVLPRVARMTRRGRWAFERLHALFPGYIFAGLSPQQTIDEIRQTPGARDVLRINTIPVQLTHGEIAAIAAQGKRRLEASLDPEIAAQLRVEIGDWVAVPDGPFVGIPVRIVAIDNQNRISASLGNVTVTFSLESLREQVYPTVQRNG